MHLTLVPYIRAAGELKTKPTQHSVRELRALGIQPDVLVCRSEGPLPESERRKIALFTNVPPEAVVSATDADVIYQIPLRLHAEGLDAIVLERLRIPARPADLSEWHRVLTALRGARGEVRVAIVGKYVEHKDAYKSISEALRAGGIQNDVRVQIDWIDAERLESEGAAALLRGVDGILVPGGFGQRGFEGKVAAVRYARERRVPYFGICYGMHAAAIEFARDVVGLPMAASTENSPGCADPVIELVTEWVQDDVVQRREVAGNLGGTMRLGAQDCLLAPNTLARTLYGAEVVSERHRHRYEFNNRYATEFEARGLVLSGRSHDGLVEIIELPRDQHPFFLACQFHPEFTATPRDGHPLFGGFVRAAREYRQRNAAPEPRPAAPREAIPA
jgi:CTP synthase